LLRAASFALLFAAAPLAGADVHVRYEGDAVHLSDRPGQGFELLISEDLVVDAARRHGVAPLLVRAVIRVESAGDPRAVSRKGAAGLMQLMPATATRYGVANRFDPAQNVEAGTRHLRELLDFFNQDLVLALAAYNAGEDAVLRYGRTVPPYAETRRYVARVRAWMDRLGR